MKNISVQEKLLDVLLEIKQDNFSSSALCYEIYTKNKFVCIREEFKNIFKLWPKFSGDEIFPVPSSSYIGDPSRPFIDSKNMWVGQYGEDRIELLDFCLTMLGRK